MNYEALMRQALALAQGGRGRVEPNPRVGALALQGDSIVGRGFHAFYGGDHAEVVALEDAARGGGAPDTLVVTLEPCSSRPGAGGKKTPPCTDRILAAGIRNVVIGAVDPDPRHHDRGIDQLRHGGVDVTVGVLADECAASNRPFGRWLQLDSPWVIAKWAMTLDGKTATPTGDSRWISNEASRTRVHEVRSHCDAVMVGFNTAVVDDPELTVRHVSGENPTRIVVDPEAEVPADSKLVQSAEEVPTWILVGPTANAARVAKLQQRGVTVVASPAGDYRGLDLLGGVRELRRRGIRRLLMEGGGGLQAKMFAAGLVHQVMVFIAPLVVGGAASSTPVSGDGVTAIADAWEFGEVFYETLGGDTLLHAFAT